MCGCAALLAAVGFELLSVLQSSQRARCCLTASDGFTVPVPSADGGVCRCSIVGLNLTAAVVQAGRALQSSSRMQSVCFLRGELQTGEQILVILC